VARNHVAAPEPRGAGASPRPRTQEAPRMAARTSARLRRAAIPAARRCNRPPTARRTAAESEAIERRAAQLPFDPGSRVSHGEKTRSAAFAPQEGLQARRAERAADAPTQHGI